MADVYRLEHPTDATLTVELSIVTADTYSDEREESVMNIIGRGRHVDYGTNFGKQGSLTAQFRDDLTTTARQKKQALEKLKNSNSWLRLYTPFGDSFKVSLGVLQFTRVPGVGRQEAQDVTIPYMEVI